MTILKLGKKSLKIKFAYEATARSGILKKFAEFVAARDTGSNLDMLDSLMEFVPELILVGVQKYHRDEYGYDYKTGEGKEASLSKIYSLLDDYFEGDDVDFDKLVESLHNELLENGFLAKMLQKELEQAKEAEKAAEKEEQN